MITTEAFLSDNLSQNQLLALVYELQKQLRAKEMAAQKERAVMEQKVQLLEAQVKEGKEREVSMKKMYETMIGALNPEADCGKEGKGGVCREVSEGKDKQLDTIVALKLQVSNLKALIARSESEKKRQESAHRQRLAEVETKEKLLEGKLREIENKSKQRMSLTAMEFEKKIIMLNDALNRTNEEHSKEIVKLKIQYEQSLNEIKDIYEVSTKAKDEILESTKKRSGSNVEVKTLKNCRSQLYAKIESSSEKANTPNDYKEQSSDLKTYVNRLASNTNSVLTPHTHFSRYTLPSKLCKCLVESMSTIEDSCYMSSKSRLSRFQRYITIVTTVIIRCRILLGATNALHAELASPYSTLSQTRLQ
eukprot:TRINITY_DN16536_c0_g3_i1.p1 TRINITY_DN16536_c0_g3~~TRINITY_DN16536_c0_g3_i1.p1  ORF type:complete len:363 (-),score=99.16 TRINITY_DN16536_c0_g3_i1:527-1615(-)